MQTTSSIQMFAKRYLNSVKASLDDLPLAEVKRTARALYRAYKTGKKVILMGNGGSGAAASHFVSDLVKGAAVPGRPRLRALALCDNIATVTAYSNDCGYECIFAEQLKNWVERGDVVIGISGSGNSKNVLNAITLANKYSAVTIGLMGFKGGKLKRLVTIPVVVNSNNMERIEDVHLIILHMLKLYLITLIKKDRKSTR
ncbi:MAG: SIS domain-containing protein [Candidatus Omnitrophota bacterium]